MAKRLSKGKRNLNVANNSLASYIQFAKLMWYILENTLHVKWFVRFLCKYYSQKSQTNS